MFRRKKPERWWVVVSSTMYFRGGPFYQAIRNDRRPREDGDFLLVSGPFGKGEAVIEAARQNGFGIRQVARSEE